MSAAPALTIHEVPVLQAEAGKLRSLTAAELSNAEAAIERCTNAAAAAKKAAETEGRNMKECRYRSIMAFKSHMPRLDTIDGCIEATACIFAGFAAGFLDGGETGKMLYAIQVAQSLLRGAK